MECQTTSNIRNKSHKNHNSSSKNNYNVAPIDIKKRTTLNNTHNQSSGIKINIDINIKKQFSKIPPNKNIIKLLSTKKDEDDIFQNDENEELNENNEENPENSEDLKKNKKGIKNISGRDSKKLRGKGTFLKNSKRERSRSDSREISKFDYDGYQKFPTNKKNFYQNGRFRGMMPIRGGYPAYYQPVFIQR